MIKGSSGQGEILTGGNFQSLFYFFIDNVAS